MHHSTCPKSLPVNLLCTFGCVGARHPCPSGHKWPDGHGLRRDTTRLGRAGNGNTSFLWSLRVPFTACVCILSRGSPHRGFPLASHRRLLPPDIFPDLSVGGRLCCIPRQARDPFFRCASFGSAGLATVLRGETRTQRFMVIWHLTNLC